MTPILMNDEERANIELLKQGYDTAWNEFVDAFAPPLQRRLLELTEGDKEKAQDYLSEILLLSVQAIGKMRKQVQG